MASPQRNDSRPCGKSDTEYLVKFEFDPQKSERNKAKHGIDFVEASFFLPPFPFLADSRFSRFETQSLPSLLRCYPRSFAFYLGNSLSWILLRLGCGSFPCARPLLSDAPFARSRRGFLLLRRGRLPLSRFFAFLAHLLLVQIPSKLLISKTAAKAGGSNCQCSCDLNWPAARCDVPRTFV